MGKVILRIFALIGLFSFPFAFKKKLIKDWIIVYLTTALSSILLDIFLVEKKLLSYPIRILPKYFKFHIVFDLLLCPIVSVFYNQFTYNDKSILRVVGKLFLFTIPQLLIEVLTGRYLNMVKWHKWWKWYHTFISMNVKYLVIRMFIKFIRFVSEYRKSERTGA
ncbi:CBO0543 family protein [Neobacillus niacini]|uniref:CBO0543 family protein n=1 Tax=Neobacillus niacini TaxID=86668 RepID=UPI003B0160DF